MEERDKTKSEKPKDREISLGKRLRSKLQPAGLGEKVKEFNKTTQVETTKLMHGARRRTMKESGQVQVVEVPFPKCRKPRPYGGGVN